MGPPTPSTPPSRNVLNLPVDAQVRVGAQVVGQVGAISHPGLPSRPDPRHREVRPPAGRDDRPGPLRRSAGRRVRPLAGTRDVDRPRPARTNDRFLGPGRAHPRVGDEHGSERRGHLRRPVPRPQWRWDQPARDDHHELNDTFDGNQTPIRSFLTTIDHGVSSLAGGKAAIDNALASISNLTKQLNGGGHTIADGNQQPSRPAIGVLAGENQPDRRAPHPALQSGRRRAPRSPSRAGRTPLPTPRISCRWSSSSSRCRPSWPPT